MLRTPDWPARITDPVTSHIAAETVQRTGKRTRNQGIALELVLRYPDCTACELANMTDRLDRYEISRRLPELAADGVICKGGRRKSRVTGNQAVTWHKAPDLRTPDQNGQPTLF